MLRFLSRRSKGHRNIPAQQQPPPPGYPLVRGIPQQAPNLKPNKHCILCKVIVLDGTDLSIELPVSLFIQLIIEHISVSVSLVLKNIDLEYFNTVKLLKVFSTST